MIIVGAGSAGKETSGILMQESNENIVFFDQNYSGEKIWNRFPVITEIDELKPIITSNPDFCVAIGHPRKREKLFNLLLEIGAISKNMVSKKANILSETPVNGTIIHSGVCISYDVTIGTSCFIHANTVIGHKVALGNFVNISPLCSVVGPCKIDDYAYIGAHSLILPNITIGKYSYITPGSIVNRDIKDYETF